MDLPRVAAVLTCAAAVSSALLAAAAPNDPAAKQQPSTAQPAVPPTAPEAANLFWQSIMNSTNPEELEAYPRRFPNGMFSELAQIPPEVLRSTAVPPALARTRAPFAIPFSLAFGDPTRDWPRDCECHDVRFEGDGTAILMLVGDRGRDAADCRHLYDEARIPLFGVDLPPAPSPSMTTSEWAHDADCDDPRFDGDGLDSFPLHSDRRHDAGDCRRLYDEGRIRLFGVKSAIWKMTHQEFAASAASALPSRAF